MNRNIKIRRLDPEVEGRAELVGLRFSMRTMYLTSLGFLQSISEVVTDDYENAGRYQNEEKLLTRALHH